MKLSTLLRRYLLSVAALCPLSYGMNPPQTPPFVTEILHLTTQCINAESTHLEDWITNTKNPLVTLQSKILDGYFIAEDTDEVTTAPTFLLLAPENQMLLERIDNMEIITQGIYYHINKPLLRKFRINVVMHNQLMQHELEYIKQSLECSETAHVARAENVTYAKGLVGISDPRLSYLPPQEYFIVRQLRQQRIDFQIDALTDDNPPINWFTQQQKLLEQYLDIQNKYIEINPLLSDQEKNRRYKKELEKTKLAIKKHHLKIKMKRTRECFLEFPCLIMLNKHKKYVEKLQKISPSIEKKETIALISAAQEARQLAEQRKQNKKAERQRREQIKAEQEKEMLDTHIAPQIPQSTADSSADKNPIPSSTYEKFIAIITAPFRLLSYISDLLWFIYG